MRLIIIFILLLLSTPVFADNTKWVENLSDGIRQSQESGLPILVYFTMDDCGYCNMMEQNTFPDRNIISALKKFISVRLKDGRNNEEIAYFKVTGFPSMSVVRNRKVVATQSGYKSPGQLMIFLHGNDYPIK